MGLAIEVGYLADVLEDEEGAADFREQLSKLNVCLKACGLNEHVEPQTCPVFSAEMYGYSGIHYLRRIAAHLDLRGKLPAPGADNAAKDPVLAEYCALFDKPKQSLFGRLFGRKQNSRHFDHLIYHSDAEGYYVPQRFTEVLFTPETMDIPGGMIGSSQQLLQETSQLAQALQLPLDLDPESQAVWDASDSQGKGDTLWQRYGVESFTCLRLHRAAKLSVSNSALIVFT